MECGSLCPAEMGFGSKRTAEMGFGSKHTAEIGFGSKHAVEISFGSKHHECLVRNRLLWLCSTNCLLLV